MKQFLIILFSLSTIGAKSQLLRLPKNSLDTIPTISSGTVILSDMKNITLSPGWDSGVDIISRDTTIRDTVACEFLITDTTNVGTTKASEVYFVSGYKVITRKGELSKHLEPGPCPEHRPGCTVLHNITVYNYPPITNIKYIRKDKGRVNKRWTIKELK